jgi:histidine triad (HIT) family protein
MTIFSRIIAGEIPCYKIAENDQFIAFLDIMPLTKGHTLVVPKTEVDYLFDLDDAYLNNIMQFAKKVAKALDASMECTRVGMAVIGLEVPHAHVHLIPFEKESDMNFSNKRVQLSSDEMKAIAQKVSDAIE